MRGRQCGAGAVRGGRRFLDFFFECKVTRNGTEDAFLSMAQKSQVGSSCQEAAEPPFECFTKRVAPNDETPVEWVFDGAFSAVCRGSQYFSEIKCTSFVIH